MPGLGRFSRDWSREVSLQHRQPEELEAHRARAAHAVLTGRLHAQSAVRAERTWIKIRWVLPTLLIMTDRAL